MSLVGHSEGRHFLCEWAQFLLGLKVICLPTTSLSAEARALVREIDAWWAQRLQMNSLTIHFIDQEKLYFRPGLVPGMAGEK